MHRLRSTGGDVRTAQREHWRCLHAPRDPYWAHIRSHSSAADALPAGPLRRRRLPAEGAHGDGGQGIRGPNSHSSQGTQNDVAGSVEEVPEWPRLQVSLNSLWMVGAVWGGGVYKCHFRVGWGDGLVFFLRSLCGIVTTLWSFFLSWFHFRWIWFDWLILQWIGDAIRSIVIRLIDRSIDWLVVRLIDSSIDWSIDLVIYSPNLSIDWVIDWLIGFYGR